MDAPFHDVDPASVQSVRGGNAIWPGMAAFTGISFFVYLLAKLGVGTVEADAGFWGQLAVSAALMAVGVWLLVRARYFYVEITTADGKRRAKGLTKAQQVAALKRFGAAG